MSRRRRAQRRGASGRAEPFFSAAVCLGVTNTRGHREGCESSRRSREEESKRKRSELPAGRRGWAAEGFNEDERDKPTSGSVSLRPPPLPPPSSRLSFPPLFLIHLRFFSFPSRSSILPSSPQFPDPPPAPRRLCPPRSSSLFHPRTLSLLRLGYHPLRTLRTSPPHPRVPPISLVLVFFFLRERARFFFLRHLPLRSFPFNPPHSTFSFRFATRAMPKYKGESNSF